MERRLSYFAFRILCIFAASILLCNGQRIRNRDRDSILFPNAADEFRLTDSYKLQTSTHTIPSRFSSDNDFSNNNNFLTEFSWNVFKGSVTRNKMDNLILSPLLLQVTLSLLQSAAVGETYEQVSQAINYVSSTKLQQLMAKIKNPSISRTELGLTAAIFTDTNFKLNQTFVAEANSRGVTCLPINFARPQEAVYSINTWIMDATSNKIRDIFKSENVEGLQVLLANAIYFRGFWKNKFNSTEKDIFRTSERNSKLLTYMKKVELLRTGNIELASGSQGSWIEIPYEGNEFSMILITPSNPFSLDSFVNEFSSNDLTAILNQLNLSYRQKVHLKMPKFSLKSTFSLVNILLKMHLVDLFTIQSQLPYLTTNIERLKIDDIIQNAVLEVDESGTVAAVAQTATVVTLSLNQPPLEVSFNVETPFLTLIIDRRNKVPLFLAKVFDP